MPNSKIYNNNNNNKNSRLGSMPTRNETQDNTLNNDKSFSDLDISLQGKNRSLKEIDIEMNKKTKYIIKRNLVSRFRKSPYVKDGF